MALQPYCCMKDNDFSHDNTVRFNVVPVIDRTVGSAKFVDSSEIKMSTPLIYSNCKEFIVSSTETIVFETLRTQRGLSLRQFPATGFPG